MKNIKGFTLIELLGVIVILSIIMVITVPVVFNIIADAQQSAALDAAYGYVKTVELEMMLQEKNGSTIIPNQFYNDANLEVRGTQPTAVCLNLTADGIIQSGWVYFGGTRFMVDILANTVDKNVSSAPACE